MSWQREPIKDYSWMLSALTDGIHDCRYVLDVDHPYLVADHQSGEVIGAWTLRSAKSLHRQLCTTHLTLQAARDNQSWDHPRV
jgi:hypothetical protein